MNRMKRILALLMCMCMLFTYGDVTSFATENSGTSVSGMIEYGSYVNFREGPGTGYSIKKDQNGGNIVLDGGTPLEILATETGSDYTWYKVNVTYNGTVYTGYVCADYVILNGVSGGDKPSDDTDFEAYLTSQGFPESYKSMLRTLHEKYPAWRFEAIQTGIKWSTLVENEVNRSGQIKNLVWTSNSYPHYNWRSTQVGYNWAADEWHPYDGNVWFAASDELVSYYLDPRTYLYENYIFLFESLSYQDGIQTKEGVEAILKGTFMYDTIPPNETQKYSEIIMEAAAASGVSPYHIASRIRLEMGTTAGDAANGNSSRYPGIYNFYNIGATDGGNALEKGLKWASESGSYGRPWDTVKKSIVGGAQFLGISYINVGQDTLYTQKFNVTNKSCLFSHQYMTNVQAPSTECLTNYNAYKKNNLLNTGMVFKIPVYTDMPQSAVTKPADSGNPNNWLSSLSVSGYPLTPSFAANATGRYSVTVPGDVANIMILAATVNSNASISGGGIKRLSPGANVFTVSVKAQNGNVRNYTIIVNRGNQTAAGNATIYNEVDYSAVYDYNYYMNKHEDLKKAYADDDIGALIHFVNYGMKEGRQAKGSFNVQFYKSQYSDLRNAYGTDLKKYYLHYINYGINENRQATGTADLKNPITTYNGVDYSAVYDYNYYINKYEDLKKEYAGDDIGALMHFVNYGMKEGRQGCSGFQVQSYRNMYSDLRNAYGNDLKKYYVHYINYGKKEGRKATGVATLQNTATVYKGVNYGAVYDYNYYISRYADIKKAFGGDENAVLAHFVNYGMKEGRQAKESFNVQSYKNKYSDLRNAYGTDLKKYYLHYINYGVKEKRQATGTADIQNPITAYNGVDYSAVYDYNYYINKYEDLKKAYAGDDIGALVHFINYGMKEGRQAKESFNVQFYKNQYSDLRNAYGTELKKYYLHYINYGVKEKRQATETADIQNPITAYNGADYSAADAVDDSTVYAGDDYGVIKDVVNYGENEGQHEGQAENSICATQTPIMGETTTNVQQMAAYYRANATYPSFYEGTDAPTIEALCQIYLEECVTEGINAEIAFCQAMNETGFLRYGGTVKIEQFNFAGIGAADDEGIPVSFDTVRLGVRAQVQHLKAYASKEPLNSPCVDPGFIHVPRGIAPCVEWLGIQENPYGRGWTSAGNYGHSIMRDYVESLRRY